VLRRGSTRLREVCGGYEVRPWTRSPQRRRPPGAAATRRPRRRTRSPRPRPGPAPAAPARSRTAASPARTGTGRAAARGRGSRTPAAATRPPARPSPPAPPRSPARPATPACGRARRTPASGCSSPPRGAPAPCRGSRPRPGRPPAGDRSGPPPRPARSLSRRWAASGSPLALDGRARPSPSEHFPGTAVPHLPDALRGGRSAPFRRGGSALDAAVRPGPLPLAELELLDLAGGRLRQLRDELHRVGRLETGQALPGVPDQLGLGGGLPVAQHHERLGPLAPLLVRHRDDRDLQDRGMGVDRALHLHRRDVLAAGDDDVLGPVAQLDVAVGMADAEVAGVAPAAAERLRGRLLVPAVALHDVVAAHGDLAERLPVGRDVVHVLVDDPQPVRLDHADALPRQQPGP